MQSTAKKVCFTCCKIKPKDKFYFWRRNKLLLSTLTLKTTNQKIVRAVNEKLILKEELKAKQ